MLPATGVVLQDPAFPRIPINPEPDLVAIHELAVDLPLAVAALEAEGAGDPRDGPGGERVEAGVRVGRIDAVVGGGGAQAELHQDVLRLACGQYLARRRPAV